MKTEYIPEKPRSQQDPRWWQTMNTGAFRLKLRTMERLDVEALSTEIAGACTVVQSQIEARGKENVGWWKSARQALGYMMEKQSLVKGELARLNKISREAREAQYGSKDERRRMTVIREERLRAIRATAEQDTSAALLELLDWLLNRQTQDEGKKP